MIGWFINTDGGSFTAFGASHISALIIYFAFTLLFLLTFRKIKNNTLACHTIRWTLFVSMVASEILYYIWVIVNEVYSFSEHLPLHLCGIAFIIGSIALVNYNRKLIQITYFIGFIPAMLALLTPELQYDYPHFRYWKFFIHHIAVSWTSIFLIMTSSVNITFKSMLESYGYLLLYAAMIGIIVNPLLGSNYLYLTGTPTANTPLDLLGDGIIYYVNLCFLAFLVFWGLLALYKVVFRKIRSKKMGLNRKSA